MSHTKEPVWDEELAERLHMNAQAWDLLVEKGYAPGQKTRLEFTFVAAERADANKLKAALEKNDGYNVKVINNDDEFEIACHIEEMALSLEGLNHWVTQMVQEGRKFDCTFDGWIAPLIVISRESLKGQLVF